MHPNQSTVSFTPCETVAPTPTLSGTSANPPTGTTLAMSSKTKISQIHLGTEVSALSGMGNSRLKADGWAVEPRVVIVSSEEDRVLGDPPESIGSVSGVLVIAVSSFFRVGLC